MVWDINWTTTDPAVLSSTAYLSYSATPFGSIDLSSVKADLGKALASKESAAIVAYYCWLLRLIDLMVG